MLTLEFEEKNSAALLHVSGIFTAQEAGTFEMTWNEILSLRPEAIALDCTKLESLDSMALIRTMNQFENAKKKGIKLFAFGLHEGIQDVFKAIKLDRIISFVTQKNFEKEYFY